MDKYTPNKERAVFEMLFPELKGCLWKDIPDLTSWEGFGLLWERAEKAEWWGEFMFYQLCSMYNEQGGKEGVPVKFIPPTRLLDALYEYGVESGRIKDGEEEDSRG